MSGVLSAREETVFEQLLQVDVIRGKDSTGVAIVKKDGYKVVKKIGPPQELLDSRAYESAMKGANQIIIGHNRWATVGKIGTANAHPFDVGTIVGVHNGTLENKYVIDKNVTYDTDSEALYAHIQEHGVKNTIQLVRGAYALVWFDEENNTLNFLRNKERPMWLVFNKTKTTLYWASEMWMLVAICSRNNVDIDKCFELPEDVHISYDIPEDGSKEVKELNRMDVKCAPPFITKKPIPVIGTTTTKPSNLSTLLNCTFKGKGGFVIAEKYTFYVRYAVKGHYDVEFRVYFGSKEEADEASRKEATIKSFYVVTGAGWPNYLSCKIVPDEIEEGMPKVTHKGQLIDKETFEKQHSFCAWCSANLDYDEDFKILSDECCVCGACTHTPDVLSFIKLM